MSVKRYETLSFKKVVFLYLKTYLFNTLYQKTGLLIRFDLLKKLLNILGYPYLSSKLELIFLLHKGESSGGYLRELMA